MNGAGRADIKEDIKEEVGSKEPMERRSLIWPPKESQRGLERATGRAHKSAKNRFKCSSPSPQSLQEHKDWKSGTFGL